MRRRIGRLALVILLIAFIKMSLYSHAARGGGSEMRCEQEVSKSIEQFARKGLDRSTVEGWLRSAGIEFTTVGSKDTVGHLPDGTRSAQMYESRIMVVVDEPRKPGSDQLVRASEVVTIGFDAKSKAVEVACEQVFTGP